MAVVLVLTALVLAAHAALVVDGWQGWGPHTASPNAAPAQATHEETAEATAVPAAPRTAALPPVPVTRVRWIEATPKVSEGPRSSPKAAPAPRPRVAPPAPQALAEAGTPEPVAPPPAPPAAEAHPSVEVAQAATPAPEVEPEAEIASAPIAVAPEQATPAPLPAAFPPPGAHLLYEVVGTAKGIRYQAGGELVWTTQNGRYDARMEVKMFLLGSRVQTSTGTLGPEGLRPERFADIRRGERAAHFERDSGRIRFSSNAPEAELQPGAQDRLSLFLQLAALLQARPGKEGEVLSFQVAGTGGAEVWRFEVGPEETLALPAGEIVARRVVRHPRDPHDTLVEMWFAPSLQHLPVRLRLTQANGDVADQLLRQLP